MARTLAAAPLFQEITGYQDKMHCITTASQLKRGLRIVLLPARRQEPYTTAIYYMYNRSLATMHATVAV